MLVRGGRAGAAAGIVARSLNLAQLIYAYFSGLQRLFPDWLQNPPAGPDSRTSP